MHPLMKVSALPSLTAEEPAPYNVVLYNNNYLILPASIIILKSTKNIVFNTNNYKL